MDTLTFRIGSLLFCSLLCVLPLVLGGPHIGDQQCPYKPDQVNNTRRCLKKCQTDADCKGRQRKCLCDDICGKSCVKEAQQCGDLKAIINGRRELLDGSNRFGATVHYYCDEGFVLSGLPTRVCQGDKYWSGQAPTCEPRGANGTCRDAPVVPNASHDGNPNQRVFPLGNQLTYTCDPGYIADGFCGAVCVGDGHWVAPDMTCSPIRCGLPPDILNGQRIGNVFVYPELVHYNCSVGFVIQGGNYRQCLANGSWSSNVPFCRAVRCPMLPRPLNGRMRSLGVTFGAMAHFSCVTGYRITGSSVRTCRQNGSWTGIAPLCEVVDCGHPGSLHNGYLDKHVTTYNSVITFSCYPRTSFVGSSRETRCMANGNWSHPVPSCLSDCRLPRIVNGTLAVAVDGDGFVSHGEQGAVVCNNGTKLEGPEYVNCSNGTFPSLPRCAPDDCKTRPRDVSDARLRYYHMRHGDRAMYKCLPGFTPREVFYVTCSYGVWIGQPPMCTHVHCNHPGSIENGDVMIVGNIGKYNYREYITDVTHNDQIEFQCHKGYSRVGPLGATCVNGVWSPSGKPECRSKHHPQLYIFRGKRSVDVTDHGGDGSCSIPRVQHGHVIDHAIGQTVPRYSVIQLDCASRYVAPINAPICNNGMWTPELHCAREYCRHPGTLENGVIMIVGRYGMYNYREYVRNVGHGARIAYQCDTGYTLEGPAEATCIQGQWSPHTTQRTCRPEPAPPATGSRQKRRTALSTPHLRQTIGCCLVPDFDGGWALDFMVGDVVCDDTIHVECDNGYPVGGIKITCENGAWSQLSPCQPGASSPT